MGAHSEAVRNRLEILLLFVDRVSRSPPPCLVNEWSVSWIHQPDDAMVDRARKISGEISELVTITELRNLWSRNRRGRDFAKASANGSGIGDEHPDEFDTLLARI